MSTQAQWTTQDSLKVYTTKYVYISNWGDAIGHQFAGMIDKAKWKPKIDLAFTSVLQCASQQH